MAVMTPTLLFLIVFNIAIFGVDSMNLGSTLPQNSAYASPNIIQPCSGFSGITTSSACVPALTAWGVLGSAILVFGDFWGGMVVYMLTFAALLVIPTLFLAQVGAPLWVIVAIDGGLWFTWFIEVLQIRTGRYLWD